MGSNPHDNNSYTSGWVKKGKIMIKKYLAHAHYVFFAFLHISSLQPAAQHKIESNKNQPKIVVVFIIDQFAYHYVPKLRPFFRHALKELCDNGVLYTNAHHAHGVPETTPGHHALSTGTLPKDHGAVFNSWLNQHGRKVAYDYDASPSSAELKDVPGCDQNKNSGKSCHNTMVDGLSDQFVLKSTNNSIYKAFSLSLKSYPAIATATEKGKPIWFDNSCGGFTSSKRYYDQLPEWVRAFNKKHAFSTMKQVVWETVYPKEAPEYQFPFITDYQHAGLPYSLITKSIVPIDKSNKKPYDLYLKTPHASQALINLAKECIDQNLTQESEHMLLWVCLSNLDLVGHTYGPDSMENIDTIYHLDRQIKELMDHAIGRFGENRCLFTLAADHGISSIPEIKQKQGIKIACRVLATPLIKEMNQLIQKKYNVAAIVQGFMPTTFQLNHKTLEKLPAIKQQAIIQELKAFLLLQKGIKQVWTISELVGATFGPDQLEHYYKTQIYKGRNGDLVCMPQPYCQITEYTTGTSHSSPYNYDNHVPIIVYQKGVIEKRTETAKVWATQLPVTIAKILDIQAPSASTYQALPGF